MPSYSFENKYFWKKNSKWKHLKSLLASTFYSVLILWEIFIDIKVVELIEMAIERNIQEDAWLMVKNFKGDTNTCQDEQLLNLKRE